MNLGWYSTVTSTVTFVFVVLTVPVAPDWARNCWAARAAQQFLAQSGATGTVRTTNTKVTVDVTVEYHPKFIPVGVLTGQGTGTSSISQNTI